MVTHGAWQFDFKRTQPMTVAWHAYHGDPKGVQAVFDAVRIWTAFKGLTPSGPARAVYTDVEGADPKKSTRLEAWVPVPTATKGDKEIQVKDVIAQRVAFTVHRGSLFLLPDARARLLQFLEGKRVEHERKVHHQVFLRMDPPNPENRGWQVEIQVPVREA